MAQTNDIPPMVSKLLNIQKNNVQNFSKYYRKADRVTKLAWSYYCDRKFFNEMSDNELKLLALLLIKERDILAHFMHPFRFPKDIRRLAAQYIDILDGDFENTGTEQMVNLTMLKFVEHGCLDGLGQMIACGANIHFLANSSLSNAIEHKHTHIVKYILENFDDFTNRGWFRIQAAKSNLKILKLVLEKFGLDDTYDLASHSENPEIIDYLRSLKRHRTNDKENQG